jgi:hypothetical protein
MKKKNIKTVLLSAALLLGIFCNTQAQSNIARIIPDGISSSEGAQPIIYVLTGGVLENVHPDDLDGFYSGFWFMSSQNVYWYDHYADPIGLRTFLVNESDVLSWEKIQSETYEELNYYGPTHNFEDSQIVYLGIYTGTSPRYDEYDGYLPGDENYWRYPDPLFGWVKLKFENGDYALLDSALGYKCKGIIIGTEELIVPTISYQIEGQTMTLTYSDSLYESADGQTWTKVTDAEEGGTYTVDISKNGSKLYCSIME